MPCVNEIKRQKKNSPNGMEMVVCLSPFGMGACLFKYFLNIWAFKCALIMIDQLSFLPNIEEAKQKKHTEIYIVLWGILSFDDALFMWMCLYIFILLFLWSDSNLVCSIFFTYCTCFVSFFCCSKSTIFRLLMPKRRTNEFHLLTDSFII